MPTTTAIPKAGGTLNADTAASANSLAQRDGSGNLAAAGLFAGILGLAAAGFSANTADPGTDTFVTMDATGGVRTWTLPAVASAAGQVRVLKKIDASGNNVVLAAQSGELIDGAASKTISSQYGVLRVWSDGAAWWTF